MRFSDIAGQNEVINRIISNVNKGRISHAQMIIGNEGSGNLALALAFAQYVNCTNKQKIEDENSKITDDSCGECESCKKSQKLIHPDIHFMVPVVSASTSNSTKKTTTKDLLPQWREFICKNNAYVNLNQWYSYIDVANKQGIISVDECNEMLSIMNYKTYEGEYKIVIIWMIEKLYYSAAPKILKILEEPPAKTLFLLISDNHQNVLDTILSRVQIIKLKKISQLDIHDYLTNNFNIDKEKSLKLADKYNSNMISILEAIRDEDDSSSYMNFFIEWMRICFRQETNSILDYSNKFREFGRERQKEFLLFSTTQLRNAWVNLISEKLMIYRDIDQETFYSNFGKYLTPYNTKLVFEEIDLAIKAIERNANPKILFTDISYKIGNYLRIKNN